MSIAKRVRDYRYTKGWGPDELASRAAISRTALYQIECGKTETPRAGTLRRIAHALEIPIEALLGEDDPADLSTGAAGAERSAQTRALGEGKSSGQTRPGRAYSSLEALDIVGHESVSRFRNGSSGKSAQDLGHKLQDLLASPLGDGIARIIEESHRLLPVWQGRRSI